MSLFQRCQQVLQARQVQQLYRRRQIVQGPQGVELVIDDQRLLNFSSNDYLGLANHAEVKKAFVAGADKWGVGSGAAHLVNGHSQAHHALEQELAEFTGRPAALLFSTGYMANLGVVAGLLGRGDHVFEDRLNHASLIDAGILSRARLRRYPHADSATLADALAACDKGEKLVVTDGVFSMDGDLAPLAQMARSCRQNDATLLVDDAHGLGVIGRTGRGSLELMGLDNEAVPLLVGTLGKSFGTFGAFVAGSETFIETLIQRARSYVYTTALPAAVAEATRTSLKLIQAESWRREKLQVLISQFRDGAKQLGLPLMESSTPIQPLLLGSAQQALGTSQALRDRGFLVTAIRPPTVPEDTARLRITFSSGHEAQHVERLLDALEQTVTSDPGQS